MSKRFSTACIPDLTGKVAIVTGGNGGIGLEIVRQLATHGARVYMASRNQRKAEEAMRALQDEQEDKYRDAKRDGKLDVRFLQLDLMSLKAAKQAALEFKQNEQRLDMLICNAGVMAPPYKLTEDGIEQSFQVNHLSHFAFFQDVVPIMIKTSKLTGKPSRLVNLSSIAHTFIGFNPLLQPDFTSRDAINRKMGWDVIQLGRYMRYSQSKLAALLFARQVNRLYKPNELRATAVHPGFVASNLYAKTPLGPVARYLFIKTQEGALAPLYAAASKDIEENDGWDDYYVTYGIKASDAPYAHNEKFMQDLWQLSEDLTTSPTASS